MLKKTITFTDFNGVERTEDFYFNLSRAELAEMEFGVTGGFTAFIQKMTATQNTKELMAQFKKLILLAYGEKSDDGKRFEKSEELSKAFSQTGAYDVLFFEMINPQKAADFFNGILPEKLTTSPEYKAAKEKLMKENPAMAEVLEPSTTTVQG